MQALLDSLSHPGLRLELLLSFSFCQHPKKKHQDAHRNTRYTSAQPWTAHSQLKTLYSKRASLLTTPITFQSMIFFPPSCCKLRPIYKQEHTTTSSKTLLHGLLTILSPHQTRIQRSKILPKGAGPLSLGCVPMATWAERGGLHRRWHPCCPARSPRRRNTSTYPCCWRRQTSVPQTTPSIKVTDQILKLLARSLSSGTKTCLWASPHLVPAATLCCGSFFQTLLWHDHHLPLLLLASVQKLPLKSLPIFFFFYFFFMVFLLPGLQTIFCSICTLKYCVNCEIFFFLINL